MRMRLPLMFAFIALTAACLMGQALPIEEFGFYQVEARLKSGRVMINSMGIRPMENSPPPNAAISPDRRRAAYVEFAKDAKRSAAELWLANIESDWSLTNKRRLPVSDVHLSDLRWMPDGRRLVYVRGNNNASPQEVFMIDVDQPDQAPTRVSEPGPRSFAPRIARDGRIAYLVERGREGKAALVDLMIFADSSRKPAIQSAHISEHAFSPDGKRIAYSTYHELGILNLETGERTVRDFKTFDDRLNAYHASCLAWRPDGQAIAAVLHFSGGVLVNPDEEPQPMFGEREVFVLPIDEKGAAIVFTLDEGVLSVQWTDGC